MGYDCSYQCVRAEKVEHLSESVVLCNLWFENEHGHDLAPQERVPVVLGDGSCWIARDPDDVLPGCVEIFEELLEVCKNSPEYDIYNPEEVRKMLEE